MSMKHKSKLNAVEMGCLRSDTEEVKCLRRNVVKEDGLNSKVRNKHERMNEQRKEALMGQEEEDNLESFG